MAITHGQYTLTFGAAGDAYGNPLLIDSIELSGTGLTVGDLVHVVDGKGHTIAKHWVEASEENVALYRPPYCKWHGDCKLLDAPDPGNWTVTVNIK